MAKRVEDYTKEELVELNGDQVNNLIDLEIAYDGIIPAQAPTMAMPEKPTIEKTVEMYEIHGLLFKDKEDAEAVVGLKVYEEGYDYNGAGYNYKYIKDLREPSVIKKMFYDKLAVDNLSEEIKEYNRLKDEYDSALGEYQKYTSKTSKIRDYVYETINGARQYMSDIKTAIDTYKKYLSLTDNDENVSIKLIKDAYKNGDKMDILIKAMETIGIVIQEDKEAVEKE